MKSSRTFSLEDSVFFRLQTYCADNKKDKNRVVEEAIKEKVSFIGLLKDCPKCGCNYSDVLRECPQCSLSKAAEETKKEVMQKQKKIIRLKESIERVDLYSQEDIEKLKLQLAELENEK